MSKRCTLQISRNERWIELLKVDRIIEKVFNFATFDTTDKYFDYQVSSYCPNIYIYGGLRFNKGRFKQEKVSKHFDFKWTFFYFRHWDNCWHSHTSDGSKKWTHIWINILCSLGYCVFHSSNCIVFSSIPRTAGLVLEFKLWRLDGGWKS